MERTRWEDENWEDGKLEEVNEVNVGNEVNEEVNLAVSEGPASVFVEEEVNHERKWLTLNKFIHFKDE